jgi:hypothetical protein
MEYLEHSNPERVKTFRALNSEETLSGLIFLFGDCTQGCRSRSNPGLKLANAFGVVTQSNFFLRLFSVDITLTTE